VNTITKSGTNDVHGSLYDYARNNEIDASNLLSAPGFNTLRFNQFGATVGGPVRRDKSVLLCRLRRPAPRTVAHLLPLHFELHRYRGLPGARHTKHQ
jgi:hypothetical protein